MPHHLLLQESQRMAGCLLHLMTNQHWWQAVCPESRGWLSNEPGTETNEFNMLALQPMEKDGCACTVSLGELKAVLGNQGESGGYI